MKLNFSLIAQLGSLCLFPGKCLRLPDKAFDGSYLLKSANAEGTSSIMFQA